MIEHTESELSRGTHKLKRTEGGQDRTQKERRNEIDGNSLPRECKVRDKLGN